MFLCDDIAEARDLTRAGLEEDPDVTVVGEASDGASAVPAIEASDPDVVLLDLSMPGGDGLEAIPRIRERKPGIGIVVFSALAASRMSGPALSRGADRYVEKSEPFQEVCRAVHDVSQRRQASGAPAAREYEEPVIDLEQFASAASHDLAEPLRVIAGFANLLARRYRGQLDEEADKYIAAILSGTDRMQALIDGLLAYSHVGQAEPVRGLVNCADLVRGVIDGLEGEVSVTMGELPIVAGEAALLGDLFQNLLSNAVKFRNERAPEVHVAAERLPGEWRFSVSDNGVGIDPEKAERVFDMFKRFATRGQPGTGIGLAICKRIVERHGGRIWVEPRPSGGSVFRFTIADPATPPVPLR